MGWKLFGWEFQRSETERHLASKRLGVAPPLESTASVLANPAAQQQSRRGIGMARTNSIDAAQLAQSPEINLIQSWRRLELDPIAGEAITIITNEAIVCDDGQDPVNLDLPDKKQDSSPDFYTDFMRSRILAEHRNTMNLLNVSMDCGKIFRRWYVDGRIAYQKIIDPANPKQGILEVRRMDAMKLRKISLSEVVFPENTKGLVLYAPNEQAFIYDPRATASSEGGTEKTVNFDAGGWKVNGPAHDCGFNNAVGVDKGSYQALLLKSDNVVYVSSGLEDMTLAQWPIDISWLQRAVRPANMYNQSLDGLLIYQYTRAMDRRVFNVDCGEMDDVAADAYVKQQAESNKSQVHYDPASGLIGSHNKQPMAIADDYWVPKRADGSGWSIDNLEGGKGLADMTPTTQELKSNYYRALNLPASRFIGEENKKVNIGKVDSGNEIARDEVQFAKFIINLRNQFSLLFRDLLRTQCLLTGVCNADQWAILNPMIKYRFNSDVVFSELKNAEIMKIRFEVYEKAKPAVEDGYFDRTYVSREIFKLTTEEQERITKAKVGQGAGILDAKPL